MSKRKTGQRKSQRSSSTRSSVPPSHAQPKDSGDPAAAGPPSTGASAAAEGTPVTGRTTSTEEAPSAFLRSTTPPPKSDNVLSVSPGVAFLPPLLRGNPLPRTARDAHRHAPASTSVETVPAARRTPTEPVRPAPAPATDGTTISTWCRLAGLVSRGAGRQPVEITQSTSVAVRRRRTPPTQTVRRKW